MIRSEEQIVTENAAYAIQEKKQNPTWTVIEEASCTKQVVEFVNKTESKI